MTADTNKQRLEAAFTALAEGDGSPFVGLMAEDFSWHTIGTTSWSGTFRGKKVVRDQLFRPLLAQFAGGYRNAASRFIAEDEFVVVECQADAITRSGVPYRNTYCYVCRFSPAGELVQLTEYSDTQLVATALAPLVRPS